MWDQKYITKPVVILLLLLTSSFTFAQAPVPDFKASSTTDYAYDSYSVPSIDFFDLSTNSPTSWLWTFTGGTPSSSTSKDPGCVSYSATGTYSVTLKATNALGFNTLTKTNYITVTTPPTGNRAVLDMSAGSPVIAATTSTSNFPVNVYGSWFVTSDIGWVVGYKGLIRKTTNGSNIQFANWICQKAGTDATLTSAYAISSNICYVVGLNGTILKTTDGGTNWTKLVSGTTNSLWCIWFTSSTTGYISGSGGLILQTTDSGANWSVLTTGVTFDLRGICFSSSTNGVAVGVGGKIIRTTDGTTWSTATSSTSNTLNSINFRSGSSIGYAAGMNRTVIKTTDGGATWSTVTSLAGSYNFYSVQSLAGLTTVSCTYGSGYLAVGDGYSTFATGATCVSTGANASATWYTSWNPPGTPDYFGWIGTTIGGQPTPLPINLLSFSGQCNHGASAKLSWATGSEVNNDIFTIERTIGSGSGETNDLIFSPVGTIKGAGNSTSVHHYEFTDRLSDASSRREEGIIYYRLKQTDYDGIQQTYPPIAISCDGALHNISIFPNPATNQAWVSGDFSGFGSEGVTLNVYDLLGRKAFTKYLGSSSSGETELLKLDISSLNAGMYAVEISSNGYQFTQKLSIQK